MQSVQYIEIDINHCSLTYGVLPCQASLTSSPPTGDHRCFNTLATCQDRANFTDEVLTLRFAVPTVALPSSPDAIPSIKSITFDGATVSLGQNLGQRATLTVTFEDHRHSDTGLDKYLALRSYNPFTKGTFFGKLRARVPFLRGRALRWVNGLVGQAYADMETRHYIIDSYSGPTNNGEYVIVAKDVLKLADGDRAVAPSPNTGVLNANITDVATSATLSPAGVGNAEYPASGWVAIGGNEACAFTRSGDVLTITRGSLNTPASDHNAQDAVQVIKAYIAQDPAAIVYDLLLNYADIPASYMDLPTWQQETTIYLNRLYTGYIASPTSVNALVSELIEQAGLIMWWKDIEQEIGLAVLRGHLADAVDLTQDNVMADSLEISEQPDKRLSSVHTYFGQVNPLLNLSEKSNYSSLAVLTDAQSESDYGSASIKEILSRWIPAGGRATADRINGLLLARFTNPPRHFRFRCFRQSAPTDLLLAAVYNLWGWPIQDDRGNEIAAPVQVTRLKPQADLIEVEGDEMLYEATAFDLAARTIIIDTNITNFNARDTHDLLYPAATSGDAVTVIINPGVIVGSTSTSTRAFDVGTWPAGVSISVKVNGRIEGCGGDGGIGTFGIIAGTAGGGGGIALYTRKAIQLTIASGQIWGGGGGGGGGSGGFGASGSGGGGAGYLPGHGGTGNFPGMDGTTEGGGAGGASPAGVGGSGGGPGLAGFPGGGGSGFAGGAAGAAIDGISFVTVIGGAGDRRGPEVS